MAFPLSSVFEGLKGLVHITVTADAAGAPEIVHFADEAGQACAHFAIHEWDIIGEHIANLLHRELLGPLTPTAAAPVDLAASHTDVTALSSGGVTATTPFLAPADTQDTEPAAGAPADAETAPAGEDQKA
jgi:hypothetical protein